MKSYYLISSILFLIVAIVHLGIAVLGIELTLGVYIIPDWMSVVAAALTAYLAIRGFSALGNMRK